MNVELLIELYYPSKSFDHFINILRRRFMCHRARKGNATIGHQPLGVCKRNPRQTGTKTPGINSQDQMPGQLIVVIFTVKSRRGLQSHRAVFKGVHNPDSRR
ncbi:hypothetical protein D3C85_1281010 [compost metagenome]